MEGVGDPKGSDGGYQTSTYTPRVVCSIVHVPQTYFSDLLSIFIILDVFI